MFVELKLSDLKKAPLKKSQVVKGQSSQPEFNGMVVFFNLFDPQVLKGGPLSSLLTPHLDEQLSISPPSRTVDVDTRCCRINRRGSTADATRLIVPS